MKRYDGLYESLYKKWELYLYRLFCLEHFIEQLMRFPVINMPPINDILSELGYDGEWIRIPPNPFIIRQGDSDLFYTVYDEELSCRSDKDKDIKKLFIDIWNRISEVRTFVGITKNTRYCGESQSDKRLVNEIDDFLMYPEVLAPIYSIMFGKIPEDDKEYDEYVNNLKAFQHFLLDREPLKRGQVKSYQHYDNG